LIFLNAAARERSPAGGEPAQPGRLLSSRPQTGPD